MVEINGTLLIQIANFLILIFILNNLLFKPILRIMSERKKKLDDSTHETSSLKEELDRKMAEYELRLKEARRRALEEREAIKGEGSKRARRIVEETQEEIGRMVDDFRTMIGEEKEAARMSLREETRSLAREIGEKVLGRSIQ
ncbi:MAG: ATP synthase F0 subunit B [Deltaproteobacteria bacterium]|nr:ATP synthase F0 subunit B [Deltaproteobacteria bacterium]